MCPWCFLTPACPCRRGGVPPGLAIGRSIVASSGVSTPEMTVSRIVFSRRICGSSIASAEPNGTRTCVRSSTSVRGPKTRLLAPARMGSPHLTMMSEHEQQADRLDERAGDLVAYCRSGWRFSDPDQWSNPIPGNHGMPSTTVVVAPGVAARPAPTQAVDG